MKPSPSQPHPMLPEPHRTSLRPDPTPESPHRSPTLSHRSRFTNTTLMSQSLSQETSLLRSPLPSHTRSQSQEPSMSQPHTRSTQSKRLSRPHTSTTPPLRLTPPKLL